MRGKREKNEKKEEKEENRKLKIKNSHVVLDRGDKHLETKFKHAIVMVYK
jgi:hypothetical protein